MNGQVMIFLVMKTLPIEKQHKAEIIKGGGTRQHRESGNKGIIILRKTSSSQSNQLKVRDR